MNLLPKMTDGLTNKMIENMPTMDFFTNVQNFMSNLTKSLQGITMAGIVLCIVLAGIMFLGGEEQSRMAKKWLGRIVIATIVVFGASTIGSTMKSVGGF